MQLSDCSLKPTSMACWSHDHDSDTKGCAWEAACCRRLSDSAGTVVVAEYAEGPSGLGNGAESVRCLLAASVGEGELESVFRNEVSPVWAFPNRTGPLSSRKF